MKVDATISAHDALEMLKAGIAAKLGVEVSDITSVVIETFGKPRVSFTVDGFLEAVEVRHRIQP